MTTGAAPVLRATEVTKSFGSTVALNDVNVNFEDRQIYGLFGRNGAGKTTLLNILSGRIFADSGSVAGSGSMPAEHSDNIAASCCYLPEKNYFPGRFKLSQLLDFAEASFPHYDAEEAGRLVKVFGLRTDRKFDQLSRGHQSIFRIVVGLASNAPITLFDEPVMGLDAVARDRFYGELIQAYNRNPRLFILSTHFIGESADLFHEVIIVKDGTVVQQASAEELVSGYFYVTGKRYPVEAFIRGKTVLDVQQTGDLKTAVVAGSLEEQAPEAGLRFSAVSMQRLFIHMTGGDREEEQSK